MEPKRLRGTSFGTLRLIVGVWFQVLFHSPHWGSFHLSLTVLSSLSVTREYLALGGAPPSFPPDFPCPMVLRSDEEVNPFPFGYGAITLYGWTFQNHSPRKRICFRLTVVIGTHQTCNPSWATPTGLNTQLV